MFTYNEESRVFWFNGNTFEANVKFELVGILMGLAIYNSNILDLHFPMACYKKLLNMQPTL
jgi:ubiquitin-protein ligase E3 A